VRPKKHNMELNPLIEWSKSGLNNQSVSVSLACFPLGSTYLYIIHITS
jgi:hypothetical protein